jgi:site-specific DNA-methyltransferase (adenine-specific)
MTDKKKLNVYNTTVSNHWGTPPDFYEKINKEFHFDSFDPCPLNGVDSEGKEVNGLEIPWAKTTFINPPYSNIEVWLKKGVEEQTKGNTSIYLIPVRPSTHYFHRLILPNAEVRFLEGRLKFLNQDGEQKQAAPFGSMLAIFRGV